MRSTPRVERGTTRPVQKGDCAPAVAVTTSWDDGHVSDLRLAELLQRHAIPATFYIAPANKEWPASLLLDLKQVHTLSQTFEIGSHSHTHARLTAVSHEKVRTELCRSKDTLEDWQQAPVTSMSYPYGAVDAGVRQITQETGFTFARTTRCYSLASPSDLLGAQTTLEAHHPYPRQLAADRRRLLALPGTLPLAALRWDVLGYRLFDRVRRTGGVFHLWGHSWVLDKANSWDRLDRLLGYISCRDDVTYLDNRDLAYWSPTGPP